MCGTLTEFQDWFKALPPVGIEPTQLAPVELEPTPLDHSGEVSLFPKLLSNTSLVQAQTKQTNEIPSRILISDVQPGKAVAGPSLDSFEDITFRLEHNKTLCICLNLHVAPQLSATGTRTRVARVRAGFPSQLDDSGVVS